MRVTEIIIYPIKATRGISLQSAEVRHRGIAGDRRWVVVDAEGQFLHQRIHPQLAIVCTELKPGGGLLVQAPDKRPLHVERPPGSQRRSVTVWEDTIEAADAGQDASQWFSELLRVPCYLAFMDQNARRPVAEEYGDEGDEVSFADALPLLISTEASLDDLNRRLDQPLPMSRFRPNVVVDGTEPWAEDDWKEIQIGELSFKVTHPCARCTVTTVDQQTGAPATNGEPLKTLATFRRSDGGVMFGQNLLTRGEGTIRIGDEVVAR